jgi:TM2 domain-containing membrane protein YozV
VSLGLNDPAPFGAFTPEHRHKSAGLAFGLSVLIPGAGQLYCGKLGRGAMTLGFWVLGLGLALSGAPAEIMGLGVGLIVVLWIFSFLDAYFTAIEINRGQDETVDVQNPRVAVVLNLLTAGVGYFYLGERTKGVTLFIVMQASRWLIPKRTGFAGGLIALVLLVIQLLMAVDAYRIARRQGKEALGPEAVPLPGSSPATRLPVHVPLVLAGLLSFGFILLAVIGLAVGAGPRKFPSRASASLRRTVVGPSMGQINPYAVPNATPIPAVDLPTAVQNIQQVERKTTRLNREDIPNLQRDVRVLGSVLTARKFDPTDGVVAHYFRGVALAMINTAHYRDGEEMDLAGSRQSLADLDKVVAGGPATARTYVAAVSLSNAEFWAGMVARNQLHDDNRAYAYWEQCAAQGHAGCTHNLAGAHITGEGGEKVDLRQALDLHASVFDSGVKYHCAGALSAMDIAYINYLLMCGGPATMNCSGRKKRLDCWTNCKARKITATSATAPTPRSTNFCCN